MITRTIDVQFGSILNWPGTLRTYDQRVRAPFKSDYNSTMRLLGKELRLARASNAVVQLAIPPGQFRNDGMPYATANPKHSGVILSFRKIIRGRTSLERQQAERSVPLSFPADKFTSWESNLRAIALSLEALRKVDRYSVTANSEQYLGFRALPPPGPSNDAIATVDEAARFIQCVAGEFTPELIIRQPAACRDAYRMAAAKLHPDAPGTHASEDWSKLQAAQSLLEAHHKASAAAS